MDHSNPCHGVNHACRIHHLDQGWGGVGKTTTIANLGGFIADAGLRVLLVDLDKQPTLSSFFPLALKAPVGIYELLAFNEQDCHRLISKTTIAGLDVIVSNDSHGLLDNLLMHAADAVRKQAPRKVARKISKAKAKPATTAKKAAAKKEKPKAKAKSSAPTVKYKDQQGNTWSGRGPQPKWLKDGLAAGKNLTDFAA